MFTFCFGIVFGVFITALMIYGLLDVFKKKELSEGYPESVELTNLGVVFPLIYIGLSVGQIMIQLNELKKDTGYERAGDIIVIVAWSVFMLFWLTYRFWTKAYLTPAGVITAMGKKGLVPTEDWQYELDGKKVRLYRKDIERPAKFSAKDAAKLEKMLTEHYIKKI
ncbi:MAG: hypothetical protein IJ071_11885 [Ruminococcus sp.]|nr:hypothetical protein [Ruminococcus sp.]